MGDHDAASIVGQMAGLGNPESQQPAIVTPDQLIEAFCGDGAGALVADAGVTEKDGVKTARGWCGYRGGRGDSLAVGFDDGYDFMGYLGERGWRALASKGDWPYRVFLGTAQDGVYAVVEYHETDLTVTVLPTEEQVRAFYASLPDAP